MQNKVTQLGQLPAGQTIVYSKKYCCGYAQLQLLYGNDKLEEAIGVSQTPTTSPATLIRLLEAAQYQQLQITLGVRP